MPKFLLEGRYTVEGAKGLASDGGSGRREAIAKIAESVGGKLDSIYFAFGDVDIYVVLDLPDSATAASVSLTVNRGGAAAIKTVVLMTPEEMDAAAKKAVSYRPPGH